MYAIGVALAVAGEGARATLREEKIKPTHCAV